MSSFTKVTPIDLLAVAGLCGPKEEVVYWFENFSTLLYSRNYECSLEMCSAFIKKIFLWNMARLQKKSQFKNNPKIIPL